MSDLRSSDPNNVTASSLFRTALPIGAFYLTEILIGLTDLAVVGALGTTPLAAVGLAKTILFSVMVVGFAVLSIGTVLMAESRDAGLRGRVVVASAILALPFTAAAIAIGWLGRPVLDASGYDPKLIAAFDAYAWVLAWALAPALLFAALKNVLNDVARTGIIAWLSVGIVFGNLAGSVVLVHGVGAWSGLGVAGAAWATLGVNAIAAALLLVHVIRAGFARFDAMPLLAVLRILREITRLGWGAGAQQALESVLFVVVLYLLGLHSALWLAAGTVVFAVMELNYAASGALGEVLSARIATARATGGDVGRLLRLGAGVSGGAAAILALAAAILSEATVALFSGSGTSPEARDLMATLLFWTAPFFLFDAWQIVFIHALRGLRRTVLPMILSTACYWLVGLGGGLFLAGPVGLGAPGLWMGFCAGLTCAAGLLGIMAFDGARRRNDVQ
jgi:MATE family multidrug resistance protein